MSLNRWRGDFAVTQQVNSVTVGGTYADGQLYSVVMDGTISQKTVAYTSVAGDTNATVAAALQALLSTSTIPEFAEATWTVNALIITGTGPSTGAPFTNISSATGTGTLVTAIVTNPTGPNWWSQANNWTLAAVPVTGDDVYIDSPSAAAILFGMSQSAVTLNSLNIFSTFSNTIGLPSWNTGASNVGVSTGGYYEYRTKALTIGATTINIGQGSGPGSGRMIFSTGTVVGTWNVYSTGQPTDAGVPSLLIQTGTANNVLNIDQGYVGTAFEPGQAATFVTIRTGFVSQQSTDANLFCGSGTVLTGATIDMNGGVVQVNSGLDIVVIKAGALTQTGTGLGVSASLTLEGGSFTWVSNGTIAAGYVAGGALLDLSRDLRGKTITNLTLEAGASFKDPFKTATFTNPFYLRLCGINDLKNIDLGSDFHLQVS